MILSEQSELNYRHAVPVADRKPQQIREQRGPPLESRSTCADDQWFRQRVRERQALLSLGEASGGVWLLGAVAYIDGLHCQGGQIMLLRLFCSSPPPLTLSSYRG